MEVVSLRIHGSVIEYFIIVDWNTRFGLYLERGTQ